MVAHDNPETLADLHGRLGFVPLNRIWLSPFPGSATESDLLRVITGADRRLVELIHGTLVEKAPGMLASIITGAVTSALGSHSKKSRTGIVCGPSLPFRMKSGNVRTPAATWTPWDQFPSGIPNDEIASTIPRLTVEVLRPDNTRAEMSAKVTEFFELGARASWIIDPQSRSAELYLEPTVCSVIEIDGELRAESVLPGFHHPLREIFSIFDHVQSEG